jgi:hypothetical protein
MKHIHGHRPRCSKTSSQPEASCQAGLPWRRTGGRHINCSLFEPCLKQPFREYSPITESHVCARISVAQRTPAAPHHPCVIHASSWRERVITWSRYGSNEAFPTWSTVHDSPKNQARGHGKCHASQLQHVLGAGMPADQARNDERSPATNARTQRKPTCAKKGCTREQFACGKRSRQPSAPREPHIE